MEWGIGCCCGAEGGVCTFSTCCRDTLVPIQATLVVANPGGGSYECRSYYYGTYDMTTAEACYVLRSAEMKIVSGTGCPASVFSTRYVVAYLPSPDNCIRVDALSIVSSSVPDSAGRWEYAGPDIQCLRSLTLTKVSTDNATFPMPNTVTLTPY